MDASLRSKAPDAPGSAERSAAPQKRKVSSPTHSSNGHSPSDTSPSPLKKKKKPGAVNCNNKDQSELRHGPFYYMKQPALTTDPVDVVPQDGRNDFYCWLCHREGQVLCCELCPRVYHAKCLKLPAEPEGDWFCPECEKITVAECIETQSKAMTMLTIDQLSYLLKFALQKIKQPGTEPFQKPVSLEQHPDYAEYIFHPMDLSTIEKKTKSIFNSAMQEMEVYVENIRKKFGIFNYAPFRTPYTPNNQLQMLVDPNNPSAVMVKTEKPDKLRFNFDMTSSPKMILSKSSTPSGMSRRASMTEMPRSPMSTNSSVHTGSDGEQEAEKMSRNPALHYSTGEESMDYTGIKYSLSSFLFWRPWL
ncbi:hypothetical protein XENOCAPTIV_013792 [Xenoophorus captivus]|uniref:Protein kinase C-binding protein 1 n=1 Tax=Xenoophorus captivus TaxID=1517983 RepID=A0ABV0RCQ3_9TELE